MSDSIVGIDVSKKSLDANFARGQRKQSRTFENSPDGWKLMLAWFKALGSKPAHVCMEATGRHNLGRGSESAFFGLHGRAETAGL